MKKLYLIIAFVNLCSVISAQQTTLTADFDYTPKLFETTDYLTKGLIVTFTDKSTSSNPISNWVWDFGDNTGATQQNPTHKFATTKVYQVKLSIVDNAGNPSITYRNVDVRVLVPDFTYSSPSTYFLIGESLSFTDKSVGGIKSWLWDFGDGTTATTKNSTHTYPQTGTYAISLTVVDDAGNSRSKNSSLEIKALMPDFIYSPVGVDLNINKTVQFTDKTIGNPDSWLWDFGDGTTSGDQNPTHIYLTPNSYNVTLTVTKSNNIFYIPKNIIVYTTPTCFDGIKNNGEKGIDCGGPCNTGCIYTPNTEPGCGDGVCKESTACIDCKPTLTNTFYVNDNNDYRNTFCPGTRPFIRFRTGNAWKSQIYQYFAIDGTNRICVVLGYNCDDNYVCQNSTLKWFVDNIPEKVYLDELPDAKIESGKKYLVECYATYFIPCSRPNCLWYILEEQFSEYKDKNGNYHYLEWQRYGSKIFEVLPDYTSDKSGTVTDGEYGAQTNLALTNVETQEGSNVKLSAGKEIRIKPNSNLKGNIHASIRYYPSTCNSSSTKSGEINNFDEEVKEISSIEESNESVVIYPNPANEYFTIKTSGDNTIKTYQIFNNVGSCVKTETCTGNEKNVDVSSLSSGVYIIKVFTQNKLFNSKLIIE